MLLIMAVDKTWDQIIIYYKSAYTYQHNLADKHKFVFLMMILESNRTKTQTKCSLLNKCIYSSLYVIYIYPQSIVF